MGALRRLIPVSRWPPEGRHGAHRAAFFPAVILASVARPESGGGIMDLFNEFSFYPLLPE
jgi:hypothetical protein